MIACDTLTVYLQRTLYVYTDLYTIIKFIFSAGFRSYARIALQSHAPLNGNGL